MKLFDPFRFSDKMGSHFSAWMRPESHKCLINDASQKSENKQQSDLCKYNQLIIKMTPQ